MGISWRGILIAALVLLPNILFMFQPKSNIPKNLPDGGLFANILEHGSRIIYFILIILTTKDAKTAYTNPFFCLMLICLIVYYILWIRYFTHGMDYRLLFDTVMHVPLPMAVFPILFFLFSALWLRSLPSAIAAVFFAVGHLMNSHKTYQHLF